MNNCEERVLLPTIMEILIIRLTWSKLSLTLMIRPTIGQNDLNTCFEWNVEKIHLNTLISINIMFSYWKKLPLNTC